ncbi:MAG: glycerophosphodiester phosphodiesterase family protein [Eubacteriales bacterium]|nr:glycerophosphodiester phosphodiesterase family protein [Eubacteriales bacterium]
MWIMLAVLLVFITLWLALIMPARSTKAQRAPFCGRTHAHRGLFLADQSVPENSLAAFRAAAEAGYGVELDVQLTRDKQVVVFHDDDLKHACDVDARVDAYSLEELKSLSLFGTGERVPLFSEVLGVIDCRIPIIVELKSGGDWKTLCQKTLELLSAYKGDYCVESFHPMLVRWFYLHAPQILRGQLSEAARYSRKGMPLYQAILMSRLFTNILTHPQFIAYRVGPKCLSVRICEWMGAMRVTWTARPTDDHAKLTHQNDAIIFEHYRPDTHF